jgi:hypothetical protein
MTIRHAAPYSRDPPPRVTLEAVVLGRAGPGREQRTTETRSARGPTEKQ